MKDLLLQLAGAGGLLISIIHGVLGETRVFGRARIEPDRPRLLMRLGWQAGAVGWASMGVLLLLAPTFQSAPARQWIVAMAVATYAFGAAGNAVATRGRHFGWMALAAIIALAIAGA